MSALPKKKLCWHCEGNIDKNLDNCPFCGVYIHSPESNESESWKPPFTLKVVAKNNESEEDDDDVETSAVTSEKDSLLFLQSKSFAEIKNEVIPMLLLFIGSCFLLFGAVLLLFSHNGTLTLQWKSEYASYFLLVGIPALFIGFLCLGREKE
jgi:hypothetical protein